MLQQFPSLLLYFMEYMSACFFNFSFQCFNHIVVVFSGFRIAINIKSLYLLPHSTTKSIHVK